MPIHSINASPSPQTHGGAIFTGTCHGPGRATLAVDELSLLRDGKRWLGVMGEIHYSRLDPAQWETAIAQMKAGGLDVIASYVFWIHHEETENTFDFTGQRDLRRFVQTCALFNLPIIIRCGPWCHGEVRNGGLPDWILDCGFPTRTLDPQFLRSTHRLYEQIANQLRGLLWKDGGPVIGIQVDNEFGGPAEYLIELKRIAREVGLDVPFYTRTGWPSTTTPVPFGELLPLFGAYAEGFWERDLTSMPGNYWKAFCFENLRTDVQVGFDQLGDREAKDDADTPQYPYLTCELGGGMEMSYHRRVKIDPRDILSVAITKIGSGSNLPGYYMYHGGVNPRGQRSTLQESQATKYWNDVPVKNYDFQAPLGSFGQVRPHYHLLRRLHLFLNDFGDSLAAMAPVLPDVLPRNKSDTDTLRWSIRSDGRHGFLFVNNYQRSATMAKKPRVQFDISLADDSSVRLPTTPATIPADSSFIWPFNLDLGIAQIVHATAQLICKVQQGTTNTFIFAQTLPDGAEFLIQHSAGTTLHAPKFHSSVDSEKTLVHVGARGVEPVIRLSDRSGRAVHLVLLDETTSLRLWKFVLDGIEHVLLCGACLCINAAGELCATTEAEDADSIDLWITPAPALVECRGTPLSGETAGAFSRFTVPLEAIRDHQDVSVRLDRQAGPAREIRMGYAKVAEAPGDADFATAQRYTLGVPTMRVRDGLLRIHYVGDVARVVCRGEVILDHFYSGNVFDVSVDLLPRDANEIELQILPLQKDSPIFIAADARPSFGGESAVARLDRVEWIERRSVALRIRSTHSKT